MEVHKFQMVYEIPLERSRERNQDNSMKANKRSIPVKTKAREQRINKRVVDKRSTDKQPHTHHHEVIDIGRRIKRQGGECRLLTRVRFMSPDKSRMYKHGVVKTKVRMKQD
jgi:hypothetical protein